jgi:hypothetical protein
MKPNVFAARLLVSAALLCSLLIVGNCQAINDTVSNAAGPEEPTPRPASYSATAVPYPVASQAETAQGPAGVSSSLRLRMEPAAVSSPDAATSSGIAATAVAAEQTLADGEEAPGEFPAAHD